VKLVRPIAVCIAAATAIGLLSGCGGSAPAGAAAISAATTTHPITKAEATAYAHAVNLVPADVPEMVSDSLEKESKPKRNDLEEARCTGGPSPTRVVVTIKSAHFRSGSGLQVKGLESGVAVTSSAKVATRSVTAVRAALKNARARACLLRLAAKGFAKGFARGLDKGISFSLGRITVSVLPDSLSSSFAFRVIVPLAFGRAGSAPFHTHVYVDEHGFVTGAAEISLTAVGCSSPVPSATEQRLVSLLYRRAKA
jgi:hypothetical protein